ncbi:ABC transporter substrate-binding protein [Nitrogeniibacter mangrovi]|uniref:ABC transporter substrate-binding protein n=1 Tax=Nitrogeniibacter mangrovi TaxID=2016596 RepID=A0A6C1B189_9RHOO|nr:ABC transporter substrate-binding protein [Nitrogeniibacter mangrovi]QID16675.1 ABC transporter substrate-binding protein [Nitrogeniibacter mangrovi]
MRFLVACLMLALLGVAQARAGECPRIVSQSPYLTMALQWLDRGACIVGVSRYDTFRPELPRTGGVLDPDAEVMTLLEPDLVVTSTWVDADVMALSVPRGTRVRRLGGFESMAQAERMLTDLARITGSPRADRAAGFHRAWRTRAAASGAHGERVLLLTACTGTPYSYGRRHMLGDLFQTAGFDVVDADTRVRAVRPGEAFPTLEALLAHFRPDIVFTFDRAAAERCRVVVTQANQRIVHLSGDDFLNPGPRQLDGLEALARVMHENHNDRND